MSDALRARLKAIDANCENTANVELEKLFEDANYDDAKFRIPSPQAAEAIWLKLIARKEHEFIQEIAKVLKPDSTVLSNATGKELVSVIEAMIDTLFAEDRYVDRMQYFYQEAARKALLQETSSDVQAKRLDLIDATYRTGVKDALRRARQNILVELDLYKQPDAPTDAGFVSQWRQYSTLSPWRMIGTIVLLSLTSYLIAFVIASDAFKGLLERFGFSSGTGL
ncbi:MAG: hypothetical protein H0X43_05210 [Nitrosospira sp.]|nr:hypothetical protein [Nitrosospira sp.]